MKTWLEEYLYQCTIYKGERIAAESAIEDFAKKLIFEVEKLAPIDETVLFSDIELKQVIRKLGINI